MPAFVLVSAKGSPGVTTVATALTAVATTRGQAMLVELDPSGGSVRLLTGASASVDLVNAAGRLRREVTPEAIAEATSLLPGGVPALLAPTTGSVAEAVIESASGRWLLMLQSLPALTVVDAGRWTSHQRTASRIVGASLVVVVCRPTLEAVERTRHFVDSLQRHVGRPAAAIVVGDRPYRPAEVAAHLDVPLIGSIAWDPRGVRTLWDSGVSWRWLRTRLARSSTSTLTGLLQTLPPPPEIAVPPGPAGPVGGATMPTSGDGSPPATVPPRANGSGHRASRESA